MVVRYIFHISDIHIMEKNYVNINNSFKTLVINIKKAGIEQSLLVIAGDIFESKSFLNTDDIYQWKLMCYLLKKENIRTLVMCGNHDYNINSDLVKDNVSLLTGEYENITCVNKTSILDGVMFNDDRLEFYIFSPIDKKIPRVLDNNNIKIAMLHEPINYAIYDNGECISGSRFTAADLKEYDYVLLGDIHLTQFLTDRIAYCGSFVQKTKGEGISKGYILWDLTIGKGVFHEIPLKEVYIKIEAKDDKCIMPEVKENQIIRHTSLIYKDCSLEYIENLKERLVNKYQYINRIVNNNAPIIVNTDISNITEGNKGYNHEIIIKEILKDNAYLPMVLKYHADILANRTENNFTTYKLNYLYWSNIFCYGENNYINFNNFHNNLVMLNGKNKEGKSSIIDIIIRVLFNECERGFKEDIVNKSKSKGFIKISFNINQDEYTIEQVFHRLSKNQQHRLYKNGVNITKDTMVNTYIYLRKEIGLGDYKDFVNMTTALQNRKFLVDMPQKDFISLLTKITNIDILKDVEDETKKKISVLKQINKKANDQINKIDIIDINTINNLEIKITKMRTEETNTFNIINDINKKLIKLNKTYNNTSIPNDLESSIVNLELTLKNITTKSASDKFAKYTIKDINDIDQKVYFLKKKLELVKLDEIKRIMLVDFSILDKYDRMEILSKSKHLRDVTYKPTSVNFRNITILNNIVNNYKKIELQPLEHCKITQLVNLNLSDYNPDIIAAGLPNYNEIIIDITNLTNKIKKFNKNFGAILFGDNCTSCTNNKTNINNLYNINAEKDKLASLTIITNNKESTVISYNLAVNYNINILQNSIFTNNLKTIEINNNIKIVDNEYNLALLEIKELNNYNNYKQLKELDHILELFRQNNIKITYEQNTNMLEIKTYIDTLIKLNELKKLAIIKESNGSNILEINNLNILEITKKKELLLSKKTLADDLELYRVQKTNFDNRNELVKNYDINSKELEFLEIYNKVVNCKTGIPSYVLKNTCIMVQNNCNEILQKIADFTIFIEYEKDIKIYTIENDIKIPATMGSGMQKFILDLIFRITLTKISSVSSPKTLFVDEGFGSLDKENFIAVATILQKLKHNFDSLIVISHISELRSYMDLSINITRQNYLSNVQYGKLSNNQLTVKLLTDSIIDNKRVNEFKDSVKSNKDIEKQKDNNDKEYKITTYINNNGGLEHLLLVNQGAKIFCNGCKKEFIMKKNFIEKHLLTITNKAKHDKYILSLITTS